MTGPEPGAAVPAPVAAAPSGAPAQPTSAAGPQERPATEPPTTNRRAVTPHGSGGLRTDIQGLRAVAVAAVVVYHLWPGALPGGYVGVDVFLVISGFLITSHLLREPPVTWAGVGRFWGRRVRRLLPASAVVVLVTVMASAVLLPSTLLAQAASEAVSSSLYVQNWALAGSAADYLAATADATPFRHYWSLSVEEQFYVVWPLLIGGATVLGARLAARRRGVGPVGRVLERLGGAGWPVPAAVALVVVSSLAWSVHLTATNPAAAYYVTPTRMWELALGGAIAFLGGRLRVGDRLRAALAWLGLGAVVVATATFDGSTPFPGAWAMLPVAGTALVIAAAVDPTSGPGRLLGLRPAQFLGDVSYSTYLWHWPLVVLAPYVLGAPLTWWHLAGVGAASVALAWVTKTWVEDPVRRASLLRRSPRWTVALLLVCTTAGAVAGVALGAWSAQREQGAATRVAKAAIEHPECFGAAAAEPGASCQDVADAVWTSPIFAAADKPQVYADGCWNEQPYDTRRTCTYGPRDADVRVALVGNSHAGHWFPAVDEIAGDRGWLVRTYLTSVCYPVDVPLAFDRSGSAEGCLDWNAWVLDEIAAGGYDLVVMSARTDQWLDDISPADQDAQARAAYGRVLAQITGAGSAVLVLRDTPNAGSSVPDCVAVSGPAGCTRPRTEAIEVDPLAQAAAADTSGRVTVVDVADVLCDEQVCHSVVGGLIVYFDHGHMTATFARTLAPRVAEGIDAALGGGS